MENAEKLFKKFAPLLTVVFTLPAVASLTAPGFFGASDDLHIAWLYEMHQTLLTGQFPPRFVPDLSFGFGYPLFNFVFPLPFYISEVFHLLGFSLVDSIKLLFLISVPLSALFMYYLLRKFLDPSLGLAGALVYAYTPYRAVDIYMRGAFGEALSFVFLPLVCLSFINLTEEKDKSSSIWIALGGLSLGCLILTHNITAYMFFPVVLLLAGLRIYFSKQKRELILRTILSVILGLLVSIFFWLPAILDSSLMKYDTVFNYSDHFPTLKQLVTPYWGYGASVPGPYDGMPFFIGIVNLLIIAISFLCIFDKFKSFSVEFKIAYLWAFLVFWIAVFMMNYRSSIVWDNLPLLPYFQFPWRFLILVTFISPFFLITFQDFKYKFLLSVCLIFSILLFNAPNNHPHDFLGRQDSYYLNRYIPIPQASSAYLEIQEEYLRLPKATEKRPEKNYPLFEIKNGNILKSQNINSLRYHLTTESQTSSVLTINKYNFPGWTALIDGKESKLTPGSPFGQNTLFIPSGSHKIEIYFKETTLKLVLDFISLISLLFIFGIIGNRFRKL